MARPLPTAITGVIIGFLVALTSVGAGVVGVVALLFLYPLLPVKQIVGADIAHALPLTLVAGLGHAAQGTVNWSMLGALLIGSLPAITLGAALAHKVPENALRRFLAVMLVVIGVKSIHRCVHPRRCCHPSHGRRRHDSRSAGRCRMTATVFLVGAGPGDPELLTVKAARLLARADVVLHDALVSPAILALAPQARLIAVGKRAHRPSTAQRFINRSLVEQAKRLNEDACVVRLKGGDPAVFGRLDEELAALRAAGIRFEIVPGISAAFGAAASLGVSLTRRGVARAVTLITPRTADGLDAHAWDELLAAQAAGATSVVYMAGRQIEQTAARLLASGLPADLPFAVAESVSTPQERSWIGSLGSAACGAATIGDGPVVLLIGRALANATSQNAIVRSLAAASGSASPVRLAA